MRRFGRASDQLEEINWAAVAARDFRSADIKEGKQAEFLVETSLPWELTERVGAHSKEMAQRVSDALRGASHRPKVEIKRDWFF